MKRTVAVAIAAVLGATLALATAGGAEASVQAKKKKCTAGLATGISWDHSDPQYMRIVPAVTWKNCRGAIRQVVMETRWIDDHGGLEDSERQTYTADIVHKANGTQAYSYPMYLENSWGAGFTTGQSTSDMKNCTQYASGRDTDLLAGSTFYVVSQAYDRNGRKILEKISPPVVCDQNG